MRVLRANDLTKRLGISATTIWRLRQEGGFPPPRRLSAQSVGWLESEVDEWLESRPVAGPAPDESKLP